MPGSRTYSLPLNTFVSWPSGSLVANPVRAVESWNARAACAQSLGERHWGSTPVRVRLITPGSNSLFSPNRRHDISPGGCEAKTPFRTIHPALLRRWLAFDDDVMEGRDKVFGMTHRPNPHRGDRHVVVRRRPVQLQFGVDFKNVEGNLKPGLHDQHG